MTSGSCTTSDVMDQFRIMDGNLHKQLYADDVTADLFTSGILSPSEREEIENETLSNKKKVSLLLGAVQRAINADPNNILEGTKKYKQTASRIRDVWPSPELDDLMNDVVSKIPAQWRAVGIQLGVPSCTLDSIQHQNAGKPQACYESFETVLSTWKQNQYKPYTWTTIIDALETPSVGQVALAEVLRAKCMERKNRSVGMDANAMRSRVQEPSPIHQRNGSNHISPPHPRPISPISPMWLFRFILYTCIIVGFLGVAIQFYINECAPNGGLGPCDHICTNTLGSFYCSCKTGYTISGYACNDINECAPNEGLGPCAQICTNTPGSFQCSCKAGYTVSGYACNDIDECAPNGGLGPCAQICTNTPGSFSCSCRAGYALSGGACHVTGFKICFQELERSSQCQKSRDTCSGLSSDSNPAWTSPFRDDTDDRSGGCQYQWTLVGIPRQDMAYRVCFNETEGSSQCQNNRDSCSGWSNSPSWSLPFRDDTDDRSGGCAYQWRIEEQQIVPSSYILACRVCFQETEGGDQCQGNGSTCSGWSTSPAPTSLFRDDTDGRSGGCLYQWSLECK